jgi:hypothetical protein
VVVRTLGEQAVVKPSLSLLLESERISIHCSAGDPVETLLAVAAFEYAVWSGALEMCVNSC